MLDRTFFVSVKSFPIDATVVPGAVGATPCEVPVASLDSPLSVVRRPMRTFAYNERCVLETRLEPAVPSANGVTPLTLVLRVLPVGALVVHAVYELESTDVDLDDLGALRDYGTRRWRESLKWYGLLHEVVHALADTNLLQLDDVSRDGILGGAAPSTEQEQQDEFVAEMEWRAWSSGTFVRLGGEEVADLPAWPMEPGGQTLPSPLGSVQRMFDNYYGWRVLCPSGADPVTIVVEELEPIAYMISRRSLCAGGIANVRAVTSAIARREEHGLTARDLRRHVGLVRTRLLAGNEYLEASDKRSRQIYVMACEDLEMQRHVHDLLEGLQLVTDEIRLLEAEEERRRDRRLSDLVSVFTVVFGVSLVIDIVLFVTAEQPVNLTAGTRWLIVLGSAVVMLGAFLVLRRRQ